MVEMLPQSVCLRRYNRYYVSGTLRGEEANANRYSSESEIRNRAQAGETWNGQTYYDVTQT